ncbi:MAG: MMPL family transporter [Clostridia bacterium]|jgi:predicted RND superfamily exporter protein|nr:MMPL family transporter [Clostridia bacterium]
MKNRDFAEIIVYERRKIEKLFLGLILAALVLIPFVGINYDMSEYLPDYTDSRKGLALMKEEFEFPGTAKVMVSNVSLYEAKEYKEKIEKLEGVDEVMWCDSLGNIYQAESFVKYDDIDDYYKDRNALFDVTFDGADADKVTRDAIDRIDNLLGKKGHMIGQALQSKVLKDRVFEEVSSIMLIVVFIILAILALSTTSWLEPILFMTVMGVAVILNKGTDIIIGQVSFLTFAISAVLQLAVATDYSIFLFHAFARVKSEGKEAEEAMVIALRESTKSIVGSGMTTFVGFLALTLMEFSIGYDLGISMAKGVFVCIACVVVLMPALILKSYKWVEKAAHKSFFPTFKKTSRFLYKSRNVTLAIIMILIIPMYYAQVITPYTFSMDDAASSEGSRYYEDEKAIKKVFGSDSMLAVIVPKKDIITERKLAKEIDKLPYVTKVGSLGDMLPEGIPVSIMPKSLVSKMHSDDYMRMITYVAASKSEGKKIDAAYEEMQSIVKKYYPDNSYILGGVSATRDMRDVLVRDYPRVNKLSIIGILIVMMITFKSVILPILAIIPIEAAITFNMAMPYFSGMEIMYLGMVMISCVLLGATVDYAILLSDTYIELRREYEREDAGIETIRKCIPTVLTSGSIMFFVGFVISKVSTLKVLSDLGVLISRGGVLGMVFVIILMPALLTLFDNVLIKERKMFFKIKSFLARRKRLWNIKGY